jgi:DeoR family glycerol-3-phosphate regulon repressor
MIRGFNRECDVKQTTRHQKIIQLVKEEGFVSTEVLVDHFSVSPQTIRRDLNELAEKNLVRRHHGGASLLESRVVNDSYVNRKQKIAKEKMIIAHAMARQIPDGSSLFIDIGTTAEALASALLNHANLRVVTNNLNVASILMHKPDFRVIIAGGEVRNKDAGIVGEATVDFINQFRMDFGIITISGLDMDGSLLDFDYQEVRVTQAIIACSREVFLPVDHTKFGRNAMVNIGNVSQVHKLFMDVEPPEALSQLLQQHQIESIVCQLENDI